ncbi:iron assimilation by reduction and transport, partial [Homalodisca vitripennis]
DSLVSYAGERCYFVLEANRPVGNYWVRFTGLMDCDQRFTKGHQVTVLHYEGAPEREPKEPGLQLKSLNFALNETGTISLPVLVANKTDGPVLLHDPDTSVVVAYNFHKLDHPMYHTLNATFRRYTPQFNQISFKIPHSPLLSQYSDVDPRIFCENHNLPNSNTTFCECLNIIEVHTNSNVEIILIDMGMDRLGDSLDVELVNKLNREGRLARNLENPPFSGQVSP